MAVRITSSACSGCGLCIVTCPHRALRPASAAPRVLPDRCDACGECWDVCPTGAIVEVEERP